MSARFTTTMFLAATLAAGCSPTEPAPLPTGTALDTILTAVRRSAGVPGLAAVVLRSSGIEAIGVTGVRRQGAPDRLTTGDRFHLGSNVKAMTATMLATLVAEGTLSWDTRPVDVFPELAGMIHPDHVNITLAQLLEHRAGIEALTNFADVPPLHGTPQEQRLQGAALLLGLPAAAPVDSFLYSNGGYGLAAAMAERVTGLSWEALMTTRLFTPLGITAEFGWPAGTDPTEPWGHERSGTGYAPYSPHQSPDPRRIPTAIAPAGEGSMTLADYARFVGLHLRGMRGESGLVDGAMFARLHTPAGYYALGWGEISINGERTATHEGSTGTFYATVFIQPERDLAVAVVTNAGGEQAGQAVTAAALRLLARYGGTAPDLAGTGTPE